MNSARQYRTEIRKQDAACKSSANWLSQGGQCRAREGCPVTTAKICSSLLKVSCAFFFFNGSLFFLFLFFFSSFFFSAVQLSHLIYPLTARVIWAPQMILQPVSSIFPCSPLPSGTWWTPGLSIPWCCLPTSSSVCLVFFPLSLYLERWFWPDLINGRHDHTTAVCVSLHWSGCLRVVQLPAGSWHGLPCW